MPRTAAVDSPGTAHTGRTEPIEPVSEDGHLVSEDAYWRDYYELDDIRYEWNNGRLEEMPVSDHETLLAYGWLVDLLRRYLESHPVGQIAAPDFGFRLVLPTGTRVRRPDCAVVRDDNRRAVALRDNAYRGIYDLCIEALSDLRPADIRRDTVTKKAEYEAVGVPEYYILHTESRFRAFYTLGSAGRYVPIPPRDDVIASKVLPGFQFRIRDLDHRRPLAVLASDPVYAGFVLPEWQHDRARADAETRRADAETRRADAEARRADAEANARVDAERRVQALTQRLARIEARQASDNDEG